MQARSSSRALIKTVPTSAPERERGGGDAGGEGGWGGIVDEDEEQDEDEVRRRDLSFENDAVSESASHPLLSPPPRRDPSPSHLSHTDDWRHGHGDSHTAAIRRGREHSPPSSQTCIHRLVAPPAQPPACAVSPAFCLHEPCLPTSVPARSSPMPTASPLLRFKPRSIAVCSNGQRGVGFSERP